MMTAAVGDVHGCFDKLQGISQVFDGRSQDASLGFCVPPGVSQKQLFRTFDAWLIRFPQFGHRSFVAVLVVSLRDSFRCAVNKR